MRFFKKTIFWVIMLIVMSGLFYFFDRTVTEREQAMEEKRRLFSVQAEDVSEITVAKKELLIELKKGNEGWLIEKPFVAFADQTAVNDMLKRALMAKIDGVLFDEVPQGKLGEMGLDPPYVTFAIKTANGNTITLSLGDRGPTQNVAFALISDDKRILRVHADVRAEVDKGLYDLRDKTAITIKPEELTRAEVLWREGGSITIRHPQDNIWETKGLPAGGTDQTKLLAFLYGVREAKIKAFIEENPKDLAAFGLAKPRVVLKFADKNNLLQTLFVGDKDKKLRGFYAKRDIDTNVFLLEEDFLDNIPEEAGDLKL